MGHNESSTLQINNVIRSESKPAGHHNTNDISRQFYHHKLLKRSEHIDFDVESWYTKLQCQTFPTEFLPISPAVARAFVNYYQTRYNSKQLLTINDLQIIQSIEYQLKQQLVNSQTIKSHTHGTFIRLSARSPKDGNPLNSQTLRRIYKQELNRLEIEYSNEYDSIEGKANMQMIAYCNAQFHSMKVTNEFEALNLILSSERVFIDLLDILDCYEVQEKKLIDTNNIILHPWNNNIIIREWNPLLDPSMEFRCFFYQSHLTAISQYNHYCKFYPLQNDLTVQQIKTTIIEYWQEKVQPLLASFAEKYANYIVDIGLMKTELSDGYQCIVIELNPFASTTGASLFDWKTDSHQLNGETNDIEIRVRSNYFPKINEYVEFIFEENQLNIEENLWSSDKDRESYFSYLNKIKTQLSL